MKSLERSRALRLGAGYIVFGLLWILVSDLLVGQLGGGIQTVTNLQTAKGWAFVIATAVFIYIVVNRELRSRAIAARHIRFQATLLEEGGEAVIAADPGHHIVYWNQAATELLGWGRTDVLGRKVTEVVRSSPEGLQADTIFEQSETSGRWRGELTLVRRDGSGFPAMLTNAVLRDPEGAITCFVLAATDLSALRTVEAELLGSKERFRALVEHATDVTSILDDMGRLLYESPAGARILGKPDGPQGTDSILSAEYTHSEDVEPVRAALAQVTDGRARSATVESRIRAADGKWIVMEHTIHDSRDNAAVAGIVVHSHDISARKRLERQLSQAQKMEAVGRLAGGIAHDFNNMLTSIGGHADFLREALEDGSPLRADADEIKRAATTAGALTAQLLAFSRQQIIRPKTLQLTSLVRDMEKMLRRLIGEHVLLEVQDAADVKPVLADRAQIEQLLLNLVVNARDAMPSGGTVRISLRNSTLTQADTVRHPFLVPGEYTHLAVEDSGTGMSEAMIQNVFEPFFTTKDLHKGTGLGLSTVYGIVKQNNGFVTVESRVGVGTCFNVYLPPHDAVPDEAPVAAPPPAGGDETILLAEDDNAIRRLASRILRKQGYRVIEAANGEAALAAASSHEGTIDLLVTDVVMPHMSGRTLAGELARHRPQMRVLFMSGYTADVMAQQGVVDTGVHLLEKPFSVDGLARTVRWVLDAPATSPVARR
jgi:two-component system, cell cycle sensor histidine kinase and response regulator CckA